VSERQREPTVPEDQQDTPPVSWDLASAQLFPLSAACDFVIKFR
jgi:hypothetical protein